MHSDIRQTQEYADYLKTIGWQVERINETNYFIKKFPLLGSVIKIQRPKDVDFEIVNKLAQKHRAFQVILEPKDNKTEAEILKNGFKLSKNPYLPSKTLTLDLTLKREVLLGKMKKDAITAIKKNEGRDIREVSTNDLEKFYAGWKASVSFNRYVPPFNHLLNLSRSFKQNPALFLTSHNNVGNIMGGAIFTRSSHDTAYYWQGFTNPEGRTTLSQYGLVWKGILWAKSQGCKVFDFEGIYDSRFPNKSWLGFTHFKKSFGGAEVTYPGAYTRLLLPFII